MGLLGWFLDRFLGPPKRRVETLTSIDESQVDITTETIQQSGTLKDRQHRQIYQDARLLPKRNRKTIAGKRRKVMEADEANRLFSVTFRTKNRKIRALLPDQEQLNRHNLPQWKTEQDVADALKIPLKRLRYFAIHRNRDKVCHYVTFAIPKRSGGERLIMAPKKELKKHQRLLHELLVSKLPVSPHAHGFRSGRSIRTGAEPHVGKKVVIHLDLKDFFPSVHFGRVRGLLITLGYGYSVATTLAVLMTESERQPLYIDGQLFHVPIGPRCCVQGAPTSPGICNAIAQKLDHRLAGLAKKFGFAYTRYADDLTFSGETPEACKKLIRFAAKIVRSEGFELRKDKTRVMRAGGPQTVTGVSVNKTLGLSRKKRREIRAAIHNLKKRKDTHQRAKIQGKLAFVRMLNPQQALLLQQRLL